MYTLTIDDMGSSSYISDRIAIVTVVILQFVNRAIAFLSGLYSK
jgi:hypothetical protein